MQQKKRLVKHLFLGRTLKSPLPLRNDEIVNTKDIAATEELEVETVSTLQEPTFFDDNNIGSVEVDETNYINDIELPEPAYKPIQEENTVSDDHIEPEFDNFTPELSGQPSPEIMARLHAAVQETT